jgi:hypothetical protein
MQSLATVGGTGTAITSSLNAVPSTAPVGLIVTLVAPGTNGSSSTPTLTLANASAPLNAPVNLTVNTGPVPYNYYVANQILVLRYNGTTWDIVAPNPTNIDYNAIDTGTANALVASLLPVPASLATLTGVPIYLTKSATANTGAAMTFNPNGLGATALTFADGSTPEAGQIPASAQITVMYTGTAFIIQSIVTRPLSINDILSVTYPVGHVLTTSNHVNPGIAFNAAGFTSTWNELSSGGAAAGLLRVAVGTGTDANGATKTFAAGANSGEYKHTQTLTELVSHNHTVPLAAGNVASGGSYVSGVNTGPVNTGNTGGGTAMNVTNPTYGEYVWTRTA